MMEFSTSLKPSVNPCCASLLTCFGCASNEHILSPTIAVEVKNFFHTHAPHLQVPLFHKEIRGWRTRAKLAVRGSCEHPEIGLFQQGTHKVIPLPNCPLHHPAINGAYTIVYDTMKRMRISPYCEKNNSGLLRYVQFVVERKSRRVQLTLVVTKEDPLIEKWVKQLYIEGGFHSLWLNYQPETTNTIFGNRWKFCEGESYVEEKIADLVFYVHPACFMQAHLSLFEELVGSIQRHILPGKKVADLYAGVGVIGLNVSSLSEKVSCVEWNPFAQECFDLSFMKCPSDIQKKSEFIQERVEKTGQAIYEAEVIIVDPPRKGLDARVFDKIISSNNAEQIIYISCNPLSFFRDCLKFVEKGWKITLAQTYLLFPGSDALEILCILEKN